MKKYFKKIALLLVGILTRDGIAMNTHLIELVVPKQTIIVPKEQGALWTKYRDTLGGYAYYPQDSSFCTWEEVEPELNRTRDRIRERKAEQAKKLLELQKHPTEQLCYYYAGRQSFAVNTFHSLVTAPILNTKELVENSENYCDVNERDDRGLTPLHIFSVRSDATLPMLRALLECGANLLNRIHIKLKEDGQWELGAYACECAIEYEGQSPSYKSVGRFFKDQCVGNEEVIKYMWSGTLHARIELKKEEEKKAKKAEYKKAVKYKGASPANEPIGNFFEKQCDVKKMTQLLCVELPTKLEKIFKQQSSDTSMIKRQRKLQRVQRRREMAEKKRAWAQELTI